MNLYSWTLRAFNYAVDIDVEGYANCFASDGVNIQYEKDPEGYPEHKVRDPTLRTQCTDSKMKRRKHDDEESDDDNMNIGKREYRGRKEIENMVRSNWKGVKKFKVIDFEFRELSYDQSETIHRVYKYGKDDSMVEIKARNVYTFNEDGKLIKVEFFNRT